MLNRKVLSRRMISALLCAALLLATPVLATFEQEAEAAAQALAPVAQALEVKTYRGIPYRARFLTASGDGTDVSFEVVTQPKHGTVAVDGAEFVYSPEEGRSGIDRFTYVARDGAGNTSAPAEVRITVSKTRSGVTYADTEGSASAAAAQWLAEEGIFTGAQLGGQYLFEPERPVSRSEFLAMTMEMAGITASGVTMTGFCDDAAIPTWAKAYASAGLGEGIVRGSAAAEGVAFRGAEPIRLGEAAVMLDRVLSVSDVDLSTRYADREGSSAWCAQAVGNMESVAVLSAGSFGSAAMDRTVTRGEAAQMLCSAMTLLEEQQEGGLLSWIK